MTALASPFMSVPRVNLMPRSEVARRERDKLVRLWVWIVFVSILVAALIVAASFWFKLMADQRLAAEQAQTSVLLTEIASLAEVSQALATESEITAFRSEAMATDLAWAPLLSKVTSILPAGTTLTAYDFAVAGAPQRDDPTLEPGVIGSVSIDSPTPLDIVAIIRSLRAVEGVLYSDGQSVISSQISEDTFTYLLNVKFDQTAYSGVYAPVEDGEQ